MSAMASSKCDKKRAGPVFVKRIRYIFSEDAAGGGSMRVVKTSGDLSENMAKISIRVFI